MRWRMLAGAAVLAATTGCGVLPAPPAPLDSNFVPSLEPSPYLQVDAAADGFTYQEHYAVRIRVATCTGWSTGSGWILSENQVITNEHVIAGATSIEVTTYDGHDYVATSSQVAPVADLALLTLDPVFTEWATWEVRDLEDDESVYVVGYPDGQAMHTSRGAYWGVVTDDVGETGEDVWELEAEVHPGNSGSPLYADDGVVVGTIYAGDEHGYAMAWPNSYLADLLDGSVAWLPNSPAC